MTKREILYHHQKTFTFYNGGKPVVLTGKKWWNKMKLIKPTYTEFGYTMTIEPFRRKIKNWENDNSK